MTKRTDRLKKLEEEGFCYLCTLNDLQESIGRKFIVADVEVAVFKINSEIFAVSNICPHQQARLIYDGFVEDEFLSAASKGSEITKQKSKIGVSMSFISSPVYS